MHARILVASLLMTLATGATATTDSRPVTGAPADLRDDGLPRVGTRFIPPPPSADFPLDKSWHELTASQQLVVRDWYENLPYEDEPPYPVGGLQGIFANIVKVQAKVAVPGHLFASVAIDAKGKATEVRFLEIPDPRLKEVLGAILLTPTYKPAKCKGKPCAMEFPVQADFGTR